MHRRLTALFGIPVVLAALSFGEPREVFRQTGKAVAGDESGAALAITHGPYLQLPASTSMTVVWHTNKKCVSKVEYGTDEPLVMTATSSRHGLIDNDRTSHVIRLAGLKPGTKYKYRVVSREFDGYQKQHIVTFGDTVASPVYEFITLDPAKASFAFSMVSDIHERTGDLEIALSQRYFEDIDFAVYNGDMINDFMQVGQVFAGFLDVTAKRFAKEKPFVLVRGNHELRGRLARTLPDYLPTLDDRAYYSFDHGGTHFIVLDSGEDKEDAHPYYNGLVDFERYRKEQAEWLRMDLGSEACRHARFRIVFSHIPPRGADGYGGEDVRRNFERAANKAGVDLRLSGHTHRFMRIDPVPGQNTYPLFIGAPDTVTRVDVSRDALKVTVAKLDGEKLDERVIAPLVPAVPR